MRLSIATETRWPDSVQRLVMRLFCNHSHTFRAKCEGAFWFSNGKSQGPHRTIQICGCYKCGKVWCEDYGA